MKVGYRNGRSKPDQGTSSPFRNNLPLPKEKSSKRLCENPKDGYSDRPAPRPSLGSRDPPWNRRYGHSTSIRIASRLGSELEGCRPAPWRVPKLTSYLSCAFAVSCSGVSPDRSNFGCRGDNSQV